LRAALCLESSACRRKRSGHKAGQSRRFVALDTSRTSPALRALEHKRPGPRPEVRPLPLVVHSEAGSKIDVGKLDLPCLP
jgi:hypothetical protein